MTMKDGKYSLMHPSNITCNAIFTDQVITFVVAIILTCKVYIRLKLLPILMAPFWTIQELYSAVCCLSHFHTVVSRIHSLIGEILEFTRQKLSLVWKSYDGNCRALWWNLYDPLGNPITRLNVTHWKQSVLGDVHGVWLENPGRGSRT